MKYQVLFSLNKRAMMALNPSPEFNEPKTQCSRAFWYLRSPFEQTQKSSTMQSSIPNFKHLSQVVLKQIFFILSIVMYKTIFVINIILHMCLQHSNTL